MGECTKSLQGITKRLSEILDSDWPFATFWQRNKVIFSLVMTFVNSNAVWPVIRVFEAGTTFTSFLSHRKLSFVLFWSSWCHILHLSYRLYFFCKWNRRTSLLIVGYGYIVEVFPLLLERLFCMLWWIIKANIMSRREIWLYIGTAVIRP